MKTNEAWEVRLGIRAGVESRCVPHVFAHLQCLCGGQKQGSGARMYRNAYGVCIVSMSDGLGLKPLMWLAANECTFFDLAMSFSAGLSHSSPRAPCRRQAMQRKHRNTPSDIGALMELGESVQKLLVEQVGAEEATLRARSALDSQDATTVVVDGDGSQPTNGDEAPKALPYGFCFFFASGA